MAAPKKRRLSIRLDMTPMVDIAFLLLIFFMATTVFKKPEEVAVQIPSSHSAFPLPETGTITITVPKDNRIYMTLGVAALDVDKGLAEVEGHAVKGKVFEPDEVPDLIHDLQMSRLVDRVVIKADREAKYGTIEKILEALQKENLNILNLVTDLEEDYGAAKTGADSGEPAAGAGG